MLLLFFFIYKRFNEFYFFDIMDLRCFMKSILVLEGGALRGIYTAGVLDVLMENDIQVDAVVGVSAGALFGMNYISKQKERCINYNLEYAGNKKYMGFYSFLTTGNIMNQKTCFQEIVYDTYPFDFETFKKSKTMFYAVVTNVETGKSEYILIDDAEAKLEYLRASGSMPLVSKMVSIDGKKYLDGAIGDSIPVKWAQDMGYDKIIVVETRPKDYQKKKSLRFPYYLRYFKYPFFRRAACSRYLHYNDTKKYIQSLEEAKEIFVIRPSTFIPIQRLEKDKNKIKAMYQLGVDDTLSSLKKIKKYLRG